jgi:pyruvate,orthophosphate dikinase
MQTEALRANLERTAVEVAVPRRHLVLLDVAGSLQGVRRDTERLLREIHHTFVGWEETVPELHRRAMGDLYHHNRHPRGAEAVSVYCGLYAKAASEAAPARLRRDAQRLWLTYLNKLVADSGDALERNLPSITESLTAMGPLLAASPDQAAAVSAGLKRLVETLAAADPPAVAACRDHAVTLLRAVLDTVYAMWLEAEDPASWLDAGTVAGVAEDFAAPVSHEALVGYREALGGGTQREPLARGALLALPDHVALTRAYLAVADDLEPDVDARTRWLCRMLGVDLLEPVHERALWALGRAFRDLVASADRRQFERFVKDVFSTLRDGGFGSHGAGLDLVRQIGTTTFELAEPAWADLVVDEILTVGFQGPEFSGFTDEWEARVNPNHVKNIRTYLSVIGADPAAARRLLAALVIHLDTRGVFIADTDLFQKDVSQLLAADIAPVYPQVRHLLRRLPVYFSDIGAEGALRDVSTRIDEIRGREDPICHFLRKQCHVESNPRLIPLVEEVARFWATGEPAPLREFLPEEIHAALGVHGGDYAGLHRVFRALAADPGIDALFAGGTSDVDAALERLTDEDPVDLDKAGLLFRLHRELARKYALDHDDVMERLRESRRFEGAFLDRIENDLRAGNLEPALDGLLGVLEDLNRVVLTPGEVRGVEDIYRKRHIGTGIPSMYGRYREERLEAAGLSFRVESLVPALYDHLAADHPIGSLDRDTLEAAARRLRLLERALAAEGHRSQTLSAGLSMLEDALALDEPTRAEFVDVFRSLTHSVQGIVRRNVLEVYGDLYETLSKAIAVTDTDRRVAGTTVLRAAEVFLRDLIAESAALQRIDALSGAVLHALNDRVQAWELGPPPTAPAGLDVFAISGADLPGPLHLGNKGYMLARLADFGFPVPPGFILTTGLGRAMRASGTAAPEAPLPDEIVARVREELARLEGLTGARFGDPANPLLLSVRAGAPISMPGMLDSFLNVGINPQVVEGLGAACGSPWAAWDAYRRFIQFWGMSRGLDRDLFDGLMSAAKHRFSAAKKAQLTAVQMRELAGDYRALLADHDIEVIDEPFAQLLACIRLVIASWDSETARLYRGALSIAEGWGTAVIVQNMVYGNLSERSGTGVLLTQHPQRDSDSFELFGDFVLQGQGDDVVSGLVETFPIAHRQHPDEARDGGVSLERAFPATYGRLEALGRLLVEDRGWTHQEIEFTFEGTRPEHLYILQAREAVTDRPTSVAAFVPGPSLARARVAAGIGVGGGALSARIAQTEQDIDRLRGRFPEDPVLLVRPDTVPDDIHLLLRADALLTSIGGATSHAAVVAKRLGKTCVVGCRRLKVFEAEGRIEIAGNVVACGDWISVSGLDGSVYLGRHEVEWATPPPGAAGIGGLE